MKQNNYLLPIVAISLPIIAMFLLVVWFLPELSSPITLICWLITGAMRLILILKILAAARSCPEILIIQLLTMTLVLKARQLKPEDCFIKFAPTGSVFVYDAAANKMKLSSLDEWNKSPAEASTYWDSKGPAPVSGSGDYSSNFRIAKRVLPTEFSQSDKKWRFNYILKGYDLTTVSVRTRGRSGWNQLISPIDDTKIATLTFDGKQSGGNGFLFGEKLVVPGTRYVEMFQVAESPSPDAPEVRKIGKTYKLYDPLESTKLNLTWTKDGQFIVAWAVTAQLSQLSKLKIDYL